MRYECVSAQICLCPWLREDRESERKRERPVTCEVDMQSLIRTPHTHSLSCCLSPPPRARALVRTRNTQDLVEQNFPCNDFGPQGEEGSEASLIGPHYMHVIVGNDTVAMLVRASDLRGRGQTYSPSLSPRTSKVLLTRLRPSVCLPVLLSVCQSHRLSVLVSARLPSFCLALILSLAPPSLPPPPPSLSAFHCVHLLPQKLPLEASRRR